MTVSIKNEFREKLAHVRKEISSLESIFDMSNGGGFGGGTSDERQYNYQIQFKKDEEARLVRDLNNSLLTKRSSTITAWIVTIATTIMVTIQLIEKLY